MSNTKGITEAQVLAAVQAAGGSWQAAAKALGIHPRTLERRKARMVARGYSPEHDLTRPVPEGYRLKGASTYYDAEGKIAGQWVKSERDPEAMRRAMDEAMSALADTLPRETPRKAPKSAIADLANCYILTDYHLGMLSWHEETGEDWDIKIAEDLLVGWFSAAIRQSPDASVGILAELGDLLHQDGLEALTPASKNVLDADTRFQKLVRVTIRALRRIIGMLLDKHETVHVLAAEGNHDPASSIWLRELLAALYEDEPRIRVDLSPDPYYCVEHGLTSLFFHHGHKRKPSDIADVFAAKFREVFGRTKYSYAHMGHLHHVDVRETNLMIVEQHRTLAAKDAFASRGGWMSGRDAKVITYSKRFGEVGRVTISPEMVAA